MSSIELSSKSIANFLQLKLKKFIDKLKCRQYFPVVTLIMSFEFLIMDFTTCLIRDNFFY